MGSTRVDGYREALKKSSGIIQQLLRFFQFLSAAISLGLFSSRLSRVLALYYSATAAQRAVQGILAAAVTFAILTILTKFFIKSDPPWMLWTLVLLDVVFVGAFIAVAILTRPSGTGSAGPHGPGCKTSRFEPILRKSSKCNLPYGTFATAIISTFLHAATAFWQDYRGMRKVNTIEEVNQDHTIPKSTETTIETAYDDKARMNKAIVTRLGYPDKHSRNDSAVYTGNITSHLFEGESGDTMKYIANGHAGRNLNETDTSEPIAETQKALAMTDTSTNSPTTGISRKLTDTINASNYTTGNRRDIARGTTIGSQSAGASRVLTEKQLEIAATGKITQRSRPVSYPQFGPDSTAVETGAASYNSRYPHYKQLDTQEIFDKTAKSQAPREAKGQQNFGSSGNQFQSDIGGDGRSPTGVLGGKINMEGWTNEPASSDKQPVDSVTECGNNLTTGHSNERLGIGNVQDGTSTQTDLSEKDTNTETLKTINYNRSIIGPYNTANDAGTVQNSYEPEPGLSGGRDLKSSQAGSTTTRPGLPSDSQIVHNADSSSTATRPSFLKRILGTGKAASASPSGLSDNEVRRGSAAGSTRSKTRREYIAHDRRPSTALSRILAPEVVVEAHEGFPSSTHQIEPGWNANRPLTGVHTPN